MEAILEMIKLNLIILQTGNQYSWQIKDLINQVLSKSIKQLCLRAVITIFHFYFPEAVFLTAHWWFEYFIYKYPLFCYFKKYGGWVILCIKQNPLV